MDNRIRILDTNILRIWQQHPEQIRNYLRQFPFEQRAITIITAEEQLRGRLKMVKSAKNAASIVAAYSKLRDTLSFFCEIKILPFDTLAAEKFADLKLQKIRIGTQDLRIAAIALSVDGAVVTRNLRDFLRVPSLVIEDWTREGPCT